MEISVRGRNVSLSESLREYASRRSLFGLGRFRHRLVDVSVTLHDVNGPRGGRGWLCKVVAHMEGGRSVLVESLETDAYGAIDRAAHRASVAVAREIGRGRSRAVSRVGVAFG